MERVFEFLEAEEMADESNKKKRYRQTKGQVVFDHVRFGYEGTDKTVINQPEKPAEGISRNSPDSRAGGKSVIFLREKFFHGSG